MSTRWRGCTPTARSSARSATCSRATTSWSSTSRRLCSPARIRSPASRARCASAAGCYPYSACSSRCAALDIFGYTAERRTERALISEYEAIVERLLAKLSAENHALAVQIASLPEAIRGFGHIKMRKHDAARKKHAELLSRFDSQQPARAAA